MSPVWLAALLLCAPAWAHGSRFSLSSLSIAPDDDRAWWGNANGWGVVRTADAGASWTWSCEEGLGASVVYDVVAWTDGQALVGTSDGLRRVGPACANEPVGGLPDGALVTVLARGDSVAYAGAYVEGSGALYRCTEADCVATSLEGLYVKSVVVGGDGAVWATTVEPDTLAAALWRSADGHTYAAVAGWPDGDVDARVLHADADRLLVWRLPRSDAAVPTLLYSADGGTTLVEVFSDGAYTDPVPGLAVLGNDVWLGSDLGRTWRSLDGGRHFVEVSDVEPAVRCAARSGGLLIVGADHFADGFDVGVWRGGQAWAGAGCLDAAAVDACSADTCALYEDAFRTAGAFGGGHCQDEPAPPAGCGGGSAVALAPLVLLLRRRSVRKPHR